MDQWRGLGGRAGKGRAASMPPASDGPADMGPDAHPHLESDAKRRQKRKTLRKILRLAARRVQHSSEQSATDMDETPTKKYALPAFDDPLFSKQWHLHNRASPGRDLNVLPVWAAGIHGRGVTVCIVDDGVDAEHSDIRAAFRADLSHDFNTGAAVPVPERKLRDVHGTRCAGLIVAQPNNGVCGVGIAWDAQVSAVRILSASVSTANEAAAVVHRIDENDIFSCSWGPEDNGRAIDAPALPVVRAFAKGLSEGRNGKGAVYIFAAGNGKAHIDNCNYDGYANGVFSLTVGAIDADDRMPPYMEPCASALVVAYSSSPTLKIATTDLGNDRCTVRHGGTSAAAPMVAGVLALVLSARPDLSWRALRHILVDTAVRVSLEDASWLRNGAGLWHSHKFGFGRVDAARAVAAALVWPGDDGAIGFPAVRPLPTIQCGRCDAAHVADAVVLGRDAERLLHIDSLNVLENVTVWLCVRIPRRGDLLVILTSPSGTSVPLTTRRPLDDAVDGLSDWTMSTVAFWGESPSGKWSLSVRTAGEAPVCLDAWRLTFWGGASAPDEDWPERFARAYYPRGSSGVDAFADADMAALITHHVEPLRVRDEDAQSAGGLDVFLVLGVVVFILLFIVLFPPRRRHYVRLP